MPKDPRLNTVANTVNEELLDRSIRHAVTVERFKTGEVKKIVGFLNAKVLPEARRKLEEKLKTIEASGGIDNSPYATQQLRDTANATASELYSASRVAYEKLRNDLRELAISEARWALGAVRAATSVAIDLKTPSPELLRSIVTSRPFQTKLLRDHWKTLSKSTGRQLRSEFTAGLALGESTKGLARRAKAVLKTTSHNAETIVRTAVNHTGSNARSAAYEANQDVISHEKWVSTLDGRTSLICAALDGRTFDVGKGQHPPAHMNCRSIRVPVTKSWKELGINLKDAPPGTRASMNGAVPADITFGNWLKTQPHSIQNQVLGKGRAELFRAGKLDVQKLVTARLKPLTLDQLTKIADKAAGTKPPSLFAPIEVRKLKNPPGLRDGWVSEEKVTAKGRAYKTYTAPDGTQFQSLVKARDYDQQIRPDVPPVNPQPPTKPPTPPEKPPVDPIKPPEKPDTDIVPEFTKLDQTGRLKVYHGGAVDVNLDAMEDTATFLTGDRKAAEWYASDRLGVNGKVTELVIDAQRSATYDDVTAVVARLSVTESELAKYAPQYLSDLDYLYVPRVRAELRKLGFDSVKAYDVIGNSEVLAIIPLDKSKVSLFNPSVKPVVVNPPPRLVTTTDKLSAGWTVEERVLESGRKYKVYNSPDGKQFQSLVRARSYDLELTGGDKPVVPPKPVKPIVPEGRNKDGLTNGWTVEERTLDSGRKYKVYHAPDGKQFQSLVKAKAYDAELISGGGTLKPLNLDSPEPPTIVKVVTPQKTAKQIAIEDLEKKLDEIANLDKVGTPLDVMSIDSRKAAIAKINELESDISRMRLEKAMLPDGRDRINLLIEIAKKQDESRLIRTQLENSNNAAFVTLRATEDARRKAIELLTESATDRIKILEYIKSGPFSIDEAAAKGQISLTARQAKDNIYKAQDFVAQLVHKRALPSYAINDSVEIPYIFTEPRARYYPSNNNINIGSAAGKSIDEHARVVAHEIGHFLENNLPNAQTSMRKFIADRTVGEKPSSMAKFGMRGEYGRTDKFANATRQVLDDRHGVYAAYIGKTYEKVGLMDTEALSVGIEMLWQDPVRFIQLDRDYALTVLKVLKGLTE